MSVSGRTAPDSGRCDAVRHFHQPRDGYRFSADSLALADCVDLAGVRTAADFGAGCGIVGLAALEKRRSAPKPGDREAGGPERFYFVERETEALEALRQNLNLYRPRTASQLEIIARDWRELEAGDFGGPLDLIIANPPYFPARGFRPSPHPGRDAARREIYGGLGDLLAAVRRLMAPRGRAVMILPAFRRAEMKKTAAVCGLAVEDAGPLSASASAPILWRLSKHE